ncbi:hypothetical protein CC85DRAFT_310437 [Cutaneotrichosporon oleaginosum]|uniref:ARM repeat-containing protein n=1 Tax=Cutaneotrichosporon oleaginosum TaxID=879819 RepID=A0A0J0XX94_9TREE|nr:uncharacterized protein CC85DRAFT_310437 [Cutaneotrichosporon oleaginosum]KLT45686.1 hypothetical protein CC85DRAFT_310437 [Cutaneotrichosporon oleaginosum]TXT04525.1 hypothetical protein COLE_07344 [Cutaneotrichosporon oleaginosum]
MADLAHVTKSLGDIVLTAGEGDEPVQLSAVLDSFSAALLTSRDPVMREAFLEAVLDVLKPVGDAADKGRLAVLHDASLTTIPPFLPLIPEQPLAREFLNLLAQHGDAREVVLALNLALAEITELADPYAVSDGESDDDDEINWASAQPQLEAMLDMYAAAVPRLTVKRSTPTLLAMQDVLVPLIKAVPGSAPPSIAVDLSRSILLRSSTLVDAAWKWQAGTEDKGGEQNAVLTDILHHAVMVFGPNVCAELTPRQFLVANPRFALHEEEGWEGGQAALDAAASSCAALGIDRAGLVERIRSSSAVRPQSSIASLLLLASNPGTAFPASTLEDAMPVINICLNGSAVDAGTALLWALVRAGVVVEYDQVTFLLEHIMPLIQLHQSPNTRLALSKLLGALIAAVKSPLHQIKLYEQILEPINPFDNIRVLALSLLRESLATTPSLLCPALTQTLTPLLYRLPQVDSPLELSLPKVLETFWPVWLAESANLVWFILKVDGENKSGFGDLTRLTGLRNLWLAPVAAKAKSWAAEAEGDAEMVLGRLVDACAAAEAAIVKTA